MNNPVIDILMYHSISDLEDPTSISPPVFQEQMDILEASGLPVITLDDYLAARDGAFELAPNSIIITFDDAFMDFAEVAFPILHEKNFPAMVYVPTGCVGGVETWNGAAEPPRRIMTWSVIEDLAKDGIHFGSHSITHPDLNELKTLDLVEEIRRPKLVLEDRLGRAIDHFAPPYGSADYFARSTIERLYKTSVGTQFSRARIDSDIVDLPRVEMFYFTNTKRWQDHVDGVGATYMSTRRAMRHAREAVRKSLDGV